ncbi:SagB/ThcOx family dehydrogenase [Persephonella sp.]
MKKIKLPEALVSGEISVEEAILKRRSYRSFTEQPLTLEEISQLLWSGQGITGAEGLRSSPSAGALYPIELYVVVGDVQSLEKGVYWYDSFSHSILLTVESDLRKALFNAALYQDSVLTAPASIVITAEFERTTAKYGNRGFRYVYMEAGHVSQNIYLQATSLGLGTVCIGAFHDEIVKEILKTTYEPIYIMPVGRIR